MSSPCRSIFLAAAALLWIASPSYATKRDPADEAEITNLLAAHSAEAVVAFQDATTAMDQGNLEAAEAGFLKVLELVPHFPDASRRLAYVARARQDDARAEKLLREALSESRQPPSSPRMGEAPGGSSGQSLPGRRSGWYPSYVPE